MVRALKEADKFDRYNISEQLSLMKEAAVDPLIKALKDEDWNIRYFAVLALGKIGDQRAELPIAQALNDEDEYVRKEAAEALKKIKANKRS